MRVRFATVSFQTFTVFHFAVVLLKTRIFFDVTFSMAPMKTSATIATPMKNQQRNSK